MWVIHCSHVAINLPAELPAIQPSPVRRRLNSIKLNQFLPENKYSPFARASNPPPQPWRNLPLS